MNKKITVNKLIFHSILWNNIRQFKVARNALLGTGAVITGLDYLTEEPQEVEIHYGHEYMKFLVIVEEGFDFIILKLSNRIA